MKDGPRPAAEPDRAAHAGPPGIGLGWQRVVLVCSDCERRKDGPRHLGAKEVRRELKHALRGSAVASRLVFTGCLGPCVKKALTIVALGARAGAVSGEAAAPQAFALHRPEDVAAAAACLRGTDPR